jgi:LysM repeat protein
MKHHGTSQVCLIFVLLALILPACAQETATPTPAVTSAPTMTPLPIGVDFATRAAPTAAFVQVTPPPLPTPTITPTATPIVYVVVEGDTLLGIALAQGRSVEAITALNPELQGALLQIGQQIILPPPATVTPLVDGGTAVPPQITIVTLRRFPQPGGGTLVVGELVNEGTLPVENISLDLTVRDISGELLTAQPSWAALPVILPGEAAPFSARFPQPLPEGVLPQVTVTGGQTVVELGSRTRDLQVEVAFSAAEGGFLLEGTVQNVAGAPLSALALVVSFYDQDESLLGFVQTELSAPLLPEQSIPFTLNPLLSGELPLTVSAVAYGTLEPTE